MPRKPKANPKPKWDDPEESRRFLEAAKLAEASNDPADFERALKRVVSKGKPKDSR
jgi:hypothetical protein